MIKHRCPNCSEYIEHTITENKTPKELKQKKRMLYYPIKDSQGNIILKNLFRIDIVSLLFLISILLLMFGVQQINEQCYIINSDPCMWAYDAGCMNCIKPVNNSMEARWNLNYTLNIG